MTLWPTRKRGNLVGMIMFGTSILTDSTIRYSFGVYFYNKTMCGTTLYGVEKTRQSTRLEESGMKGSLWTPFGFVVMELYQ